MATKELPALTAATATADDDLLLMRDTSETEDVKLTLAQLVSLYGLLKNPATTDGDLITRASGVMARLPIGGAGTVLTSTGTAIEWGAGAVSSEQLMADAFINEANSALTQISANVWAKAYYLASPVSNSYGTLDSDIGQEYMPMSTEAAYAYDDSGVRRITSDRYIEVSRKEGGSVVYFFSLTLQAEPTVILVKYFKAPEEE